MKTGNKNPIVVREEPSFTENSMSSPLILDSVKIKYFCPALSSSIGFGTIDYDAHPNTRVE